VNHPVHNFLESKFEVTKSVAHRYIGLQIETIAEGELLVRQTSHMKKVASRHELAQAKPVDSPIVAGQRLTKNGINDGLECEAVDVPYRHAIGSLMYISLGTRPDISFAVSFLSRFSEQPKLIHWNAVKRVIKYLASTPDVGLRFIRRKNGETRVDCHSDADFAMDADDRKSTTGFVIRFNGTPII